MLLQAKLATTDCIVMTLNFYILLFNYSLFKKSLKNHKLGLVKSL